MAPDDQPPLMRNVPVLPGAVLWGASMEEPGLYRVTARGPGVGFRVVRPFT